MGTRRVNWRVELAISASFYLPVTERDCKDVVTQIERHVDGVEACHIVFDTVCEFCLSDWKGAIDKYGYPWCCAKAQKETDGKGILPFEELLVRPAPETPVQRQETRA